MQPLIILSQLLFGFWPIILLTFLNHEASLSARNRLLLLWLVFFVFGAILVINDLPPLIAFPEPINSSLFILLGLLILFDIAIEAISTQAPDKECYQLEDLLTLSPDEFEEFVADFFRNQGHHVMIKGTPGDHGIDILISTKAHEKWIVQCKRYRSKVGEPALRDLYGAMHAVGAQKGFLVTTSSFSAQARKWANGKTISLIDGKKFLGMVNGKIDQN
jgi:hypothetical protein